MTAPQPGTSAECPRLVDGGVASYEHRGVNPSRLQAIERYAGHSILDLGCGNGSYVMALAAQRSIIGADHQLFPGWSSCPGRFAVIDVRDLRAVRSKSVDTVLLFEVLEHLEDPANVLREVGRICRKNVILSVPNAQLTDGMTGSRLIYYHWIDRTHRQFFDRASLVDLIDGADLRVESVEAINPIQLAPLITEAFGLARLQRLVERIVRMRQKVPYAMTLLAVARPAATH
jgi:2-polyprenyl-3-methyl-5-hydroxy-6-metoxy-1,4-benzoquinol methylase